MAARTNKYASVNFNHIYDKNHSTNNKQNHQHSPQSDHLPLSRNHGRMLVLTRPTPKPITPSTPPPQPHPDQARSVQSSDSISLRPLGTTGSGSPVLSPVLSQEQEKEVSVSPKPNRFVPPHLRPGFVGKEERPGPEVFRSREVGQRNYQQPGILGSPGGGGKDGRPNSGGYERMKEGDIGFVNRPRSSGNRPNSSG